MKEIVTIKATDVVRRLAQTAHDIQDASNPQAVCRFMREVMGYFSETGNEQKYVGSDMAAQNPISIAVLNKLNHLAGLDQSRVECFGAILDLADGTDVEWEIHFDDRYVQHHGEEQTIGATTESAERV